MKQMRSLLALMLLFTLCTGFIGKKNDKEKGVYAFGVAASFSDTLVYYTDIQLLDSVRLDKNNFLPKRQDYSRQLKEYVQYQLVADNYTTMIYFSENKEKLQKRFDKTLKMYKKDSIFSLHLIPTTDFKFKKPEESK